MRRHVALCLALACCNDLEEIELSRCGNGVLEQSEDCDGYAEAPGGERCIDAGQPAECRYSCALRDDGVRDRCPDGFGCGHDGVCRRASGLVDRVVVTGQPGGRFIGAADFDGDGHDDVVNQHPTQFSIDFVEAGSYRETFRLPLDAEALPLVTHLDSDTRADLLVPTALGLAVWRGSSTRRLLPTTYTGISVRVPSAYDFVAIDLIPDVALLGEPVTFPGDEPLALTSLGAFPALQEPAYGVGTGHEFDVDNHVGYALSARFDEQADAYGGFIESPEQLAVGLATEVQIFRPSYFEFEGGVFYLVDAPEERPGLPPATHPGHTTVSLPPGEKLMKAPLALQLNAPGPGGLSHLGCDVGDNAVADEHLDLLLRVEGGVVAAFGLGDGTFHGYPCELDEVAAGMFDAGNAAAVVGEWLGCGGDVLAAGDIDGDGAVDFVTPVAVRLSGRVPLGQTGDPGLCQDVTAVPKPDGKPWTEAVIADFNGDGRNDVLAASADAGIDLLTSAPGSRLNPSRLATVAPASLLSAGDFDGNGIGDAAFIEAKGDGEKDLISVVFGEAQALPTSPAQVGALKSIERLSPLDFTTPYDTTTVDAATDLIVSIPGNDSSTHLLAGLYGRADRQLQAPFVYTLPSIGFGESEGYNTFGAAVASFGLGCGAAEPDVARRGLALMLAGSTRHDASNATGTDPDALFASACVEGDGELVPGPNVPFDVPVAEHAVKRTAIAAVTLGGSAPEPVLIRWVGDQGQALRIDLLAPVPAEGAAVWALGEPASILGAVPAGTQRIGDDKSHTRLWTWAAQLSNVPSACRFVPGAPETLVFMAVHENDTCGSLTKGAMKLHILPAATLVAMRAGGSLVGASDRSGDDGRTLLGFACLNADADAADELALLWLDGPDPQCDDLNALEGSGVGRGASVEIVQADASGNLELTGTQLVRVDAAQLSLLSDTVPPVSGLARGDFNGDGVDDLALAAQPSSLLLLGEPVNR